MDFPFYKIEDFIEDKELLDKIFLYFYNLEWEQDTYIIHGKKVSPKRKTYMYGHNYSYSGQEKKSHAFDKQVIWLAHKIEEKMNLPKNYFNACLCNFYEDGQAYLSYHKDDEPEMDKSAPIVSFSIGETRKFYLKHDTTKEVVKLNHEAGKLLVMLPETQEKWKHSIPKESKVKSPRISLTFRKFNIS